MRSLDRRTFRLRARLPFRSGVRERADGDQVKRDGGFAKFLQWLSADLWPVWRMMSLSLTPFMAASVTHPARRLWPPKGSGFRPARLAARFKIQPTQSLWSPDGRACHDGRPRERRRRP